MTLTPGSRIYISGPMTGLPESNYPAFHEAAAKLEAKGYKALNPALHFDGRKDLSHATFLRADIPELLEADAIAFLPGWQKSRGARLEAHIARELEIPMFDADTLLPLRVNGDPRFMAAVGEIEWLHARKGADYGTDEDPFANVRASEAWGLPAWVGAMVRAQDKVIRMQTFVRKGRLVHEGVEDSLLDLATYSLIALVLYREQSSVA